ncbi:Eukaryotic translation initiation factor 2D [Nymphon striatum]|nr:Eukaryotic translation initiation factor 2D [Nymphon striatum]
MSTGFKSIRKAHTKNVLTPERSSTPLSSDEEIAMSKFPAKPAARPPPQGSLGQRDPHTPIQMRELISVTPRPANQPSPIARDSRLFTCLEKILEKQKEIKEILGRLVAQQGTGQSTKDLDETILLSEISLPIKKRLRSDISEKFPNLKKEEIDELVPLKSEISVAKVASHSGNHIFIYYNLKTPIFFSVNNILCPTVYALWTYPHLLHRYYTTPNVLEKFSGGADLMLPGIITDMEDYGPRSFGDLGKGQMCSICIVGNDAPIAVGVTAMSSQDMFDSGKRGKGVIIYHVYSDQLWRSGNMSSPPNVPSTMTGIEDTEQSLQKVEVNDICDASNLDQAINKLDISEECELGDCNDDVEDSQLSPVEEMDNLLYRTFLCALRISAKKIEFPILTSTFYRLHMVPCCPHGCSLDIKKSSYKKLSKFLNEMKQINIILVQELSKGVESITNVNMEHPEVKKFRVVKADFVTEEPAEEKDKSSYDPPEVVELFCITAPVAPIFRDFKHRKGDFLSASDVRKVVTDYVKKNELQNPKNGRFVKLDPHLTDAILNKNEYNSISELQWEDINARMLAKMLPGYQMTFPGRKPIVKKGKLSPIDISMVERRGCKIVTLVNNMVTYGIDATEFARRIQSGVAASVSVNPAPPNRKDGPQVLIQGNQVKYIGNLLTGEYGIPKKLIKGFELAPKKKLN